MKWIRIAAAGFALCAAALVAGAQGAPPSDGSKGEARGAKGGRGMMMLFEGITLTDAQSKQVADIREKYRGQMQDLRPARPPGGAAPGNSSGAPPDPAARQKMKDLQARQQTEMRAILTA
ncbi:MAG TPA: Spy/CpxP family protein refolding chaperone, partial [Gemmatimonadaceae bacterium]|nr:Spy/CpxP family protein refolding chaperone [Gemmatimonadaceae bacterium]